MDQQPQSRIHWTVVALGSVFGVAVVIPLLDMVISRSEPPYAALSIFSGAFLIGSLGAAVYVVVQAITDPRLTVFQNIMSRKIDKRSVILIFVIAGGIVAGISTLAAGALTMGNSWTVFLLGFGWQGAIAGVAGSTAVSQKAREAEASAQETEKKDDYARKLLEATNRENERKYQELKTVLEREATSSTPVS